MTRLNRLRLVAAACGLLLPPASPLPAQAPPAAATTEATADAEPLRFFFITDVHSRHRHMERIVHDVTRVRPHLVLDGGDMVHDGTESEFRRALADRARTGVPWHVARGNHDAEFRGPFAAPPPALPALQAVEHGGVRFIVLDNHDERISPELFQRLEAELEAAAGLRIVVVMHVPALLGREPFLLRLRHLLPFPLASPVMRDPAEVERFTRLMERHGVLAVLAGHTHYRDEVVRGGVRYVVGGAAGGLTPGLGVPNEYLDVTLTGRELDVRRVGVAPPPGDPLTFIARAFRFYAELNGFNHAEQGWNYVPSASVQFRSALRRTETGGAESVAAWGAASFERNLGVARGRQAFFGDLGASVGRREAAAHLAAGYKFRPVGDFNRNLFVAGAATGNAGMLGGRATAGVGVQAGGGMEWRGLTGEVSRNWATNHRALTLAVGHRF